MQEEHLGKANPIYGLMSRRATRTFKGFETAREIWGQDMLVVFQLLSMGRLVLAPDVLFHKRLEVQPSRQTQEPKKRDFRVLVEATARVFSIISERRRYFRGYALLVESFDALTATEKRKLQIMRRRRALRLYREEIRQGLLVPIMRRIAENKNLVVSKNRKHE
jgi:hypothetical protein